MKTGRFTLIKLLMAFCLLFFASGCVYYNTFFNARQAFNDAENQRKSKGVGSTGGYQTAIEKALKVAEKHPNSKYYDDALYVLGVSYYYTNQHLKSERRCRELLANYPNSKYAKEMTLYLARAKLKLNEEEEAFQLFEEIFQGKFSKEYRAEAALELGQYQREEKGYAEAERYFRAVRDSLGNDQQQRQAQKDLADTYFESFKFADALSGYLQMLGMKPAKSERYIALYRAALCSYKLQRIPVGMEYLDKLIKDPIFYDSLSTLQLTLGQGHEYSGDLAQAEVTYEEVASTARNLANKAEACYRLGLIYQFDYDDLIRAKEYYDKSAEANRTTDAGKDALQRGSDIAKMQSLSKSAEEALAVELQDMKERDAKDSVAKTTTVTPDSIPPETTKTVTITDSIPVNSDTTAQKSDTLELRPTFDSTMAARIALLAPVDSSAKGIPIDSNIATKDTVVRSVDSVPAAVAGDSSRVPHDTTTKTVDSLTHTQLIALPTDSARTTKPADSASIPHDTVLVVADSIGPATGAPLPNDSSRISPPLPVHAKIEGLKPFDSLAAQRSADSLAAKKATADTLAARKAIQERIDNSGKTLYQLAELFWFQLDKPDSAMNELQFLLDHYPTSAIAPRAMIALAQMHRDYLADTLGADSLLRLILKQYPRSDYVPLALAELNLVGSTADSGYAQLYFRKAEDFLIDSANADSALYYYQYVADNFRESPLNIQARYNVIWVKENYLSPGDSSIAIAYKMFADSFPGTPYAQDANRKLTYRPPERKPVVQDKDSTKQDDKGDDEAAPPVAIRIDQPDTASGAYVDPRERVRLGPKGEELVFLDIEPIEITVEFDFPAEAYGDQQEEYQLYFQILLDFSGKVVDFDLKVPSSVAEINRRARLTVASMKFDPLGVNKELTSKSTELILPEDKADPRGRWYVYKFIVRKPGHAR